MNSYWKEQPAWGLALPPNRPTPEVLSLLTGALATVPRSLPVCVLGSTIEYRNVFHGLQFSDVTIIDSSEDFYRWTCAYVPNHAGENFQNGDWLDILGSIGRKYFLIASDLTLGNLEYRLQAALQEEVFNRLEVGGIFFDRILYFNKSGTPLECLNQKYRYSSVDLRSINSFNEDYLFSSELVTSLGVVDTEELYIALQGHFSNDKHLGLLLNQTQQLTPRGLRWYYGRPWEEVSHFYLHPPYAEQAFVPLRDFGGNCAVTIRKR